MSVILTLERGHTYAEGWSDSALMALSQAADQGASGLAEPARPIMAGACLGPLQ